MATINPILSGYYPALPGREASAPPLMRPDAGIRPDAGQQDVFQQGQWERNRVAPDGQTASVSGCRCGSCAMCASQAYENQAKKITGRPSDEEGMATGAAAEQVEESEEYPVSSQVKGIDGEPLAKEELALLAELKQADAAVRAHEQAHLAAAGGLATSGASFSYQRGPDGHNYAVAGEVQIDTSKGATPEKTLAKMARVRAAALAPVDPSPQDRKVAAAASSSMSEARQEINLEKLEARKEQGEDKVSSAETSAEDQAGFSAEKNENRTGGMRARAASRYQAMFMLGKGGFVLSV